MKKLYFAAILSFVTFTVWSQDSQILKVTKQYLESQTEKSGFKASDFNDLTVLSNYTDKKTNVEYAYVQQNLNGYPIYNAIATFALKNGEVVHMTHNFQKNILQAVGNQTVASDLENAALTLAQNLGYTFNETAVLNTQYKNELVYYPTQTGKINLSWSIHLNFIENGTPKIMQYIVNAATGEIYQQNNHLLSEHFEPGAYSNPMTEYKRSEEIQWLNKQYAKNVNLNDGSKYNVFQLPVEAPNFGDRTLILNPADPIASPYGWHDDDGEVGPEYTYTRGNNVIAVNDKNSDAMMWLILGGSYTFEGFAEGGEDLNFDFPLDFNKSLYKSSDASTANLFYMNNVMHDIWYQYGFTEEAGNFQANNYGAGGAADDAVIALGQTGESFGFLNNAMFSTPPDGQRPSMYMFMWESNDGDDHLLAINTPGDFEGNYSALLAAFGAGLPDPPITDDLVVMIDDDANGGIDPHDGCENLTNAAELDGKIAVVKRGNCNFVVKVNTAQSAGARAVVVVNNVGGAPIVMGGDDPTIDIPSIMISQNNGNPIIDALLDGVELNASVPKENHYDGYKDGSFDNGIVAHEYGHGISLRLTGGPSSSCLNNDEQMGEGWSDYFALVMTMYPGDNGEDGRGIGTYAISQPTTGGGIRPTRYSTNMSVNPATYNTIKTQSIPHGVGYVWATMLWEMTWELIDTYGFDPDLYHGTGGNNLAMQLVIDGLKLQPCSPGFVTGRDAILTADELNNEGANQCHIWKAFAKRGLGWEANQGSPNSTTDGTQSFEMPPQDVLDCSAFMDVKDLDINRMSLYPNPTKGEFYVITEKPYNDAKLSIQDLTGKTVFQADVDLRSQRAIIDISSLQTGVYIIVIQTEQGKITKKLIKK